eukprot:3321662-Rhodomonas_salina.2
MRDTAAALGAKIDLPNDFLENARVAWVPASGKEEGRWAMCWPSSLLEKAPNLFNIRYRMHKEVNATHTARVCVSVAGARCSISAWALHCAACGWVSGRVRGRSGVCGGTRMDEGGDEDEGEGKGG